MFGLFQNIDEFSKNIVYKIIGPFFQLPGFLQLIIFLGILVLCIFGVFSIANKLLRKIVAVACAFVVVLIVYLIIFK